MDLLITLDNHSPLPLHQQIYEEVRQAILCGKLPPGKRIPSTREMAKALGVSRSTVTQSYEQLLSEGYLETVIGSGTYICTQLPDDLFDSQPVEYTEKNSSSKIKFSEYGMNLLQTKNVPILNEKQLEISFRYGRPALNKFPLKLWKKLLDKYCNTSLEWLDYSIEPLGYKPLREAIAIYISRVRGINCEPEQVLITNGTQQALDLIMRLLIEPGNIIALEEPGYLSARLIFQAYGAKLLPIAVDESGLVINKLVHSLEKDNIRLVYITPSHQFPTGAILSLPRRLELLNWASQTGSLIIEDDYDSEYRYGDRPIPALQGLDNQDSVLYVGTFSKVLFPSLRIGYLVLPKNLVTIFARAKWLNDRHLPILEQQVLTDFIAEGHLERHIRKMRSLYDYRRQVLVKSLKFNFGESVEILGDKAGLHVMVRLNTNMSDDEIIQDAAKLGVGMMSASSQYLNPNASGEFIFGYGELDEEKLVEGVYRLTQVIKG
ncbi:PLP-dependent aminotransferase family protein [Calothrix sp. UHCC 0171]|uniref:MocR-like pyridoxine biosynthesis transcription factor PdxR n=1 Tax=Calothrix sp. UHCC 0171 TaxID=3110245 RepID=UPI002B1FD74E|nr:PLP-dependent aminotransferase family protein [Calothrix sp. UHCC 0171]MEA5574342.1 PLP-dependent aminotransferase family protein [Calothrix sp. UHCC 0171]